MKYDIFGIILSIGFTLFNVFSFAQCPSYSVTLPSTVCLNEKFDIINTTPAASYTWDFCTDDLKAVPAVNSVGTIPSTNYIIDIQVAESGNSWYGFVLDYNVKNLVRLDFGNDPRNSVVSASNLGNPNGLITTPSGMELIYDGSSWFAVLINGIDQTLVLYEFGNSLTNVPTARVIYTGIGQQYANLSVVRSGNSFFIAVSEFTTNTIRIINFANGLTNPAVGENSFALGSGFNPIDIQIIEECGTWYAFALGFTSKVIARLDYGIDLSQTPVMTLLSTASLPFFPYRMQLLQEGDEYVGFVTDINGGLARMDLGASISNNSPSLIPLGNFSVLSNSWSFDAAFFNGAWTVFMPNGNTGLLYQLIFQNNCTANPGFSYQKEPANIEFSTSGIKKIALTMRQSDGSTSSKSFFTSVTSHVAPAIDIDVQGACVNQPVSFLENIISGTVNSRSWNFGDAGTSSLINPSHSYLTTGNFDASLKVIDNNLCTATASKSVSIYSPPVAQFNLPSVTPICTNQNYVLSNVSTFDAGSNPTWEWRLNGVLVSTQQNFTGLFSSPVAQDIRLKAVIPGCENEVMKTISTVIPGPFVDFSVTDNCQGNTVPFTNQTIGADAGFVWDFGDGTNSVQANPLHNYLSPNTFQITLTGSNSQGCQNFITKPIKIFSVPQPDFSISLPPFSCANSPTQFQNNTLPLTDSNITQWNWQFGDTGTSSQQTPTHTYTTATSYSVGLTATSNKGCSAAINKSVSIYASPVADFGVGPSCLNLSTNFTDASSGSIQSRQWQIASSTFSTINPSYTFTSPGDYFTSLTTTSANGCISVKTKTVTVPVAPAVSFTNSNPCVGKNIIFTDATSSPQDIPVSWSWNFAGNSVDGNPATYIFSPSGTYTVKLMTTHASGCKYTLSKNVTINPSPTASFTASPDRGSAPLTVQFTSASQPTATYSWKFYDKVTATSTQPSPVYTFAALGDYSAELTVNNAFGCADFQSVPIKVLVPSIDLIMQDFKLTTDPATGKIKGVVTIYNNCNIPVTAAEVALLLADKAVVNETLSLNLNPGQFATRTLSFTLSPNQFDFGYLCAEVVSDKDIQLDNNKRCINLGKADYILAPYPSPTSGILQIDWISSITGSARITVFDETGKRIYEWGCTSEIGINQTVHDLTFLTSGMYYVTIITSGAQKTLKFIRQ